MKKTNNKILFLIAGVILLLNINAVFAHEHNFNETKQLIDSEISCDNLTDEQLEIIGEYYMEKMHPGEAHELMDKMMGGEDSESLREMHINMAKSIYCGESRDMIGMMGGGMMSGQTQQTNMMGSGMMGNFGFGFSSWNFISLLYLILLIGLIILIILLIVKVWKNIENKKGRK